MRSNAKLEWVNTLTNTSHRSYIFIQKFGLLDTSKACQWLTEAYFRCCIVRDICKKILISERTVKLHLLRGMCQQKLVTPNLILIHVDSWYWQTPQCKFCESQQLMIRTTTSLWELNIFVGYIQRKLQKKNHPTLILSWRFVNRP